MGDRLPEGDRAEVLGLPAFIMPTREHPAFTTEGIPFYVIVHKGEEVQIGDTVEIIPLTLGETKWGQQECRNCGRPTPWDSGHRDWEPEVGWFWKCEPPTNHEGAEGKTSETEVSAGE
jgi:hypothetical protein